MKILKDLLSYLKNKEDVLSLCRYAEKNGYADCIDWNWRQRLRYWEDCMAHDDWKSEEENENL